MPEFVKRQREGGEVVVVDVTQNLYLSHKSLGESVDKGFTESSLDGFWNFTASKRQSSVGFILFNDFNHLCGPDRYPSLCGFRRSYEPYASCGV